MKRIILFALLVVLLLSADVLGDAKLSENEIMMKKGEKKDVYIIINNTENTSRNYTISINSTISDWLTLEVDNISVEANRLVEIKCTISVPRDAKEGEYSAIFYVMTGNVSEELTLKIKIEEEITQVSAIGFILAILPLIIILLGITLFKQSGMVMAFVGLIITIILAVAYFRTSIDVAIMASVYGFIKSFGISIAVIVTMYMIFLMKEMGLLKIISNAVGRVVTEKENLALFMGIGFGSFLTSLGVVTPALFPPVLIAMGFSPTAAIAISVLGYNATTSFALLSIPITLPAEIFQLNSIEFAFKVSIFLPVISVGIAWALLWMLGGKKTLKNGLVGGFICGFSLAIACLVFTWANVIAGAEVVPLPTVGIFAGLVSMLSTAIYDKKIRKENKKKEIKNEKKKYTGEEIIRAFSPWIILTILACIISIPLLTKFLMDLPGDFEKIRIYDNKIIDLNVLSQIYFWIFVAVILTIILLRPSKKEVVNSFKIWLKRMIEPFLAYSLYFSIAFVMAWSAMEVVNGKLVRSQDFASYNMNNVVGGALSLAFGYGYLFVAGTLGLFGAVVGGSETSSNVMFYAIQKKACSDIGIVGKEFMTVYGAHAVAGGVASAITPAKINNAVAVIGEKKEMESKIMKKHLVLSIILTISVGIMTVIFVSANI